VVIEAVPESLTSSRRIEAPSATYHSWLGSEIDRNRGRRVVADGDIGQLAGVDELLYRGDLSSVSVPRLIGCSRSSRPPR